MQLQVVILSYNHPQLTKSTIQSALRHFEGSQIVLVHNGSLTQNVDELKRQYPNIRHLEITQNLGYSGGANFGLSEAFKKSEWVLFITNDCELLQPGTLPAQPGFYAPLIFKRNTGHIDSLGGAWNTRNLKLRHLQKVSEQTCRNELFYVPGTAFLMHRDFFQKTNGFDEKLGTYWEDVDLSLRAHELGLKVHVAADFQLKHKIGKTCHKNVYYTSYLFIRNQNIVSRRYAGHRRLKIELQLAQLHVKRALNQIRKKNWQSLQLQWAAFRDSI